MSTVVIYLFISIGKQLYGHSYSNTTFDWSDNIEYRGEFKLEHNWSRAQILKTTLLPSYVVFLLRRSEMIHSVT